MATRSSSGAELLAALLERPWVRRLGRFLLSAVAVQGVYTAGMGVGLLLLHEPRQAVLLVAFLLSLTVHFSLNRQWVFNPRHPAQGTEHHVYSVSLSGHGMRYVLLAAAAYAVTALSLGLLPGALGVAPFLVWLATSGAIGALNFFVLGRFVFR